MILQALELREIIATTFTIWSGFYLLYYSYEGIKRVLAEEIKVSVGTTTVDNEVDMPLVTLCPRYIHSNPIGYNNQVMHNISFSDALQNGLDKQRASLQTEGGTKMEKVYRFHQRGLDSGALMFEPCYTFLKRSSSGTVSLYFNMTDVADVSLIFHEKTGIAYTLLDFHDRNQGSPYFESQLKGDKRKSRHTQIEVELVKNENRLSDTKCVVETETIDEKCIEKYLQSQLQCRLTWETIPDSENLRPCSTEEDFSEFGRIMNALENSNGPNLTLIRDLMKCGIPCDFNAYNHRIIFDQRKVIDNDNEDLSLKLELTIKKVDMKIITRGINYDVIAMIGDVGGFTGFLLGYSFLTLIDFLYEFWQHLGLCSK